MIPLYKPYMPELPDINDILHSGQIASGKYTNEFENILKQYFKNNNLIVTNSFNTAISVAITCLELRSGDEIIASPMSCLASTQSYNAAGLKIIWADIDPKKGTIDPDSLKKKISKKTRCIIHNHFCGYPGYINEINNIAHKNGIYVIDDGIECFGAEYNNNLIGNCGTDITVFSFNAVRMITTIDGGAVLFNNENLYKKSLFVRDCGIDRKNFRDENGEINPQCDISLKGYSATLSNVNAYIGIQQMKELDSRLKIHRKNAEFWKEKLKHIEGISFLNTTGTNPNYWVFGILANDKGNCISKFRQKGIYASSVHINNNIYSIFNDKSVLPGTEEFFSKFLALPCGCWVEKENISYAIF